ncbi:MAG: GNAT family N-acetyltransferase [Anaerolineales bacterium]|nr:GNAT family N-acetyltransferase [Anaerolineales bacterium]
MIQVVTLDETLRARYTSYLTGRDDARFGHDLAWANVLRDAYGVETRHLVALEGDRVVGICPFFLCKPLVGGAHYVTNPFPTYCGPLTDSAESLNAALKAVAEKTSSVDHAEVLTPASLSEVEAGLLPSEEKLDNTYRLSLENGIERIFESLDRDYKRILRKSDALKNMELIVDDDGSYLDAFHKLYVNIYAGKHGFIPHGKRLFRAIFRHFPKGAARIYLARVNGRMVGAMFTFWSRNEVYYGWSAVLPDSAHHPTHFLIWRIIQDAVAEGSRWFNMGEAARDHHGLNHFKRGWGTEISEPCRYFIAGQTRTPSPRLFDRVGWTRTFISKLPAGIVTTFLSPAIRFFL